MKTYEIDFSYKLPEWGVMTANAENEDEAEQYAIEELLMTYPDIVDLTIDGVKEFKDGQD